MSDGAFRDDQEAALARADALEDELAREKRENAKLRAEADTLAREKAAEHERAEAAEKQVPKPRPSKPAPEGGPQNLQLIALVGGGGFLALFLGLAMLQSRCQGASVDERKLEEKRWKALVGLPRCLQTGLADDPMTGVDPATQDPRGGKGVTTPTPAAVGRSCTEQLDVISAMPAFAPEAAALARWRTAIGKSDAAISAINDYYTHRDWKDDQYASGPAKWHAAQRESAEQHAAARAVVDRALGILETELRRYQRGCEDARGRDATWWRLELGIQLQIAADDYLRGDIAKAKVEAAAVESAAAAAPLEVRRATRDGYKASSAYFPNDLLRGLGASTVANP